MVRWEAPKELVSNIKKVGPWERLPTVKIENQSRNDMYLFVPGKLISVFFVSVNDLFDARVFH